MFTTRGLFLQEKEILQVRLKGNITHFCRDEPEIGSKSHYCYTQERFFMWDMKSLDFIGFSSKTTTRREARTRLHASHVTQKMTASPQDTKMARSACGEFLNVDLSRLSRPVFITFSSVLMCWLRHDLCTRSVLRMYPSVACLEFQFYLLVYFTTLRFTDI